MKTDLSDPGGEDMSREFRDALADCLDRLVDGEDIRECLKRYPKQADELEPLLQVAVATIRAAESATPDLRAKARNFERFSQAVAAGPQPRKRTWRDALASLSWTRWRLAARPVAIGLAAVLVFALSAGMATAASDDAAPGEPLYWVKSARENVERRLPRSNDNHAIYEASLAHARSEEVSKLVEKGRFAQANHTMRRMNDHLVRSARYAGVTVWVNSIEMPFKPHHKMGRGSAERLRNRLEEDRRDLRDRVEIVLESLSPDDRARAVLFFKRTELGYWLMIDAMKTHPASGKWYHVEYAEGLDHHPHKHGKTYKRKP